MKKIIVIIVILFPICLYSQNSKFDKLIKKYDVIDYVKGVEKGKPELFWSAIWNNNKQLLDFIKACQKEKRSAMKAVAVVRDGILYSQRYYDQLQVLDAPLLTDTLKKCLYNNSTNLDIKRFDVIGENYANAFATPDGQIFITDSLIYLFDFSHEMLLGICAHEMAHRSLTHSYLEAYETQKKLQRNNIVAGVVSGLNAGANAYAQANGVASNDSWDDVNKTTIDLFESAHNDAYNRFRYKYSREQEIEADIIAYRFLEWCGIGGEYYIRALKLLGTDGDKYYNEKSNHPTTKMRIQLLEYLSAERDDKIISKKDEMCD